jgi:hypothetical protein
VTCATATRGGDRQVHRDPWEARPHTAPSSITKAAWNIIRCCRAKGQRDDHSVGPSHQGRGCCLWVSRSRGPATARTAGRPPSDGQLGEDGPERARDTHLGGVASSLAVCAADCAKPVMDACLYICNRCGVPPTVIDPSPLCKPHTGWTPPRASTTERRVGIGQDRRGLHLVGMTTHLYENVYYIEECYESTAMSRQIVAQTRSISILIHKAHFAYEYLLRL